MSSIISTSFNTSCTTASPFPSIIFLLACTKFFNDSTTSLTKLIIHSLSLLLLVGVQYTFFFVGELSSSKSIYTLKPSSATFASLSMKSSALNGCYTWIPLALSLEHIYLQCHPNSE
ncbi:hypothetical protein QL285_013210 [Trifolium repens]|nr:hypothetical protein QL285_013210 [Trifolium repens]